MSDFIKFRLFGALMLTVSIILGYFLEVPFGFTGESKGVAIFVISGIILGAFIFLYFKYLDKFFS